METFSFESQFKGAIRERYRHKPVRTGEIWVVTDLEEGRAARVLETTQRFLSGVPAVEGASWRVFSAADAPELPDLMAQIEARGDALGLLVCYRNLRESPRHPRVSLGHYVDSLTQFTDVPVLIMPVRHPDDPDGSQLEARLRGADTVMVITDHLTDDLQLVRYGAEFTQPGGKLYLSHIEDEATFERYVDVISKIPELDTDIARETIKARLLKEPADMCASAEEELDKRDMGIEVTSLVRMGQPVVQYRDYLNDHELDLLVADSKNPDRFAMSDLAYAISIEFIDVPILLL